MNKWSKREDEVMESIGFTPQPGSGNGLMHKEDGRTEDMLAQLKSTEGKTISVKVEDVKTLFYNARVSHKLPVFLLDFMEDDILLVSMRLRDLQKIAKAFKKLKRKGGIEK